jgi:hypothetical protein
VLVIKWTKGNVSSKLGKKALVGGKDTDGSTIFVGRAFHGGVYLPAKIIPSKKCCYVGESEFHAIKFIEDY